MSYYSGGICIIPRVQRTQVAEAGRDLSRSSRATWSWLSRWDLSIATDRDPTASPGHQCHRTATLTAKEPPTYFCRFRWSFTPFGPGPLQSPATAAAPARRTEAHVPHAWKKPLETQLPPCFSAEAGEDARLRGRRHPYDSPGVSRGIYTCRAPSQALELLLIGEELSTAGAPRLPGQALGGRAATGAERLPPASAGGQASAAARPTPRVSPPRSSAAEGEGSPEAAGGGPGPAPAPAGAGGAARPGPAGPSLPT